MGGRRFQGGILEQLVGQHHAGSRHDLKSRKVGMLTGPDPSSRHLCKPARTDAELRSLVGSCDADENARVGLERGAIIHDGTGA
jgi:hypothetical protein